MQRRQQTSRCTSSFDSGKGGPRPTRTQCDVASRFDTSRIKVTLNLSALWRFDPKRAFSVRILFAFPPLARVLNKSRSMPRSCCRARDSGFRLGSGLSRPGGVPGRTNVRKVGHHLDFPARTTPCLRCCQGLCHVVQGLWVSRLCTRPRPAKCRALPSGSGAALS